MTDLVARTIDVLRANAPRWGALASGLDRELLARRPAPGEWSALECLGHAADTEGAIFAARVRALMGGEPRLASYDPDAEGTRIDETTDPAALVARHAALRQKASPCSPR